MSGLKRLALAVFLGMSVPQTIHEESSFSPPATPKTLMYFVGNNLTVQQEDVQQFCENQDAEFIHAGSGDAVLPVERILETVEANNEDQNFTILLNAHGNRNRLGKHFVEFANGNSEVILTSDLFSSLAEASGNKPIDCMMMSCHSGAAISDYKNLPKGSSLICTSAHSFSSATEDSRAYLEYLAGCPNQPHGIEAASLFLKYLHNGLSFGDAPVLIQENGDIQDPYVALKKRIHAAPAGKRFSSKEIQAIQQFTDENLMSALEIINSPNISRIYDIPRKILGDCMAVAHILSPESEASISAYEKLEEICTAIDTGDLEALETLMQGFNINSDYAILRTPNFSKNFEADIESDRGIGLGALRLTLLDYAVLKCSDTEILDFLVNKGAKSRDNNDVYLAISRALQQTENAKEGFWIDEQRDYFNAGSSRPGEDLIVYAIATNRIKDLSEYDTTQIFKKSWQNARFDIVKQLDPNKIGERSFEEACRKAIQENDREALKLLVQIRQKINDPDAKTLLDIGNENFWSGWMMAAYGDADSDDPITDEELDKRYEVFCKERLKVLDFLFGLGERFKQENPEEDVKKWYAEKLHSEKLVKPKIGIMNASP